MSDMEKFVKYLIERAAKTQDSGDALRFSQAACNAANAMCALGAAQRAAAGG